MAAELWHYLENQFDNSTKESFKLMNIVNADHLSRLKAEQADPQILALVTRTEPLHNNYKTDYASWLSAQGFYKGATNNFEKLLAQLSGLKIKEWDVQIQGVHLEGTSQYTALLPNRRGPFQEGTYENRISEVESLAQRLLSVPALSPTQVDVDAFHATIESARDEQQQREGKVETTRDDLEDSRVALAIMMHRNLGFLIDKFAPQVERVSNFWELALIRETSGTGEDVPGEPIEGTVAPGSTESVLSEGVQDVTSFIIENTGTVPLTFCTAGSGTEACPISAPIITPGQTETLTPEDLGASGQTFLNVTNTDTGTAGSFTVVPVTGG